MNQRHDNPDHPTAKKIGEVIAWIAAIVAAGMLLAFCTEGRAQSANVCGVQVTWDCGGTVTTTTTVSTPTTTLPPSTACNTSANVVGWTAATQVLPMQRGSVWAVAMVPSGAIAAGQASGTFSLTESSSTGDQADVQFSISRCPGDFSARPDTSGTCADHAQYSGGSLSFSIGRRPPSTPFWSSPCILPAGTTTVYFNVRQIKRPTPIPPESAGEPSCQFSSCPVLVKFN